MLFPSHFFKLNKAYRRTTKVSFSHTNSLCRSIFWGTFPLANLLLKSPASFYETPAKTTKPSSDWSFPCRITNHLYPTTLHFHAWSFNKDNKKILLFLYLFLVTTFSYAKEVLVCHLQKGSFHTIRYEYN